MLSQLLVGVQNVFSLNVILFILVGVIFGMIMGALPGLSTTMAIALALPLTFSMAKIPAMALLMGIFTGGIAGGSISAILINVPGTAAAVASCFDGAPMARNGQAAKAITASIVSAFFSGVLGTAVLMFLAPSLAKFALKFGPFEYFSIAIFALTLIITLAEKNLVKGLISGLIGVAFTLVGSAPIDGTMRYTFGLGSLRAGISTLPFLIAIFAMTSILEISHKQPRDLKQELGHVETGGSRLTVREYLGQTWNLIRSSAIGFAIGVLPGIGAGTSNIISYMAAKNSSKHPEQFGTGCLDGVVAPEAAGCAGTGGALTILLTVGIPGDTNTAMLLGALILHGMTPGPLLFTTNGDVVYSIFISLLVANVLVLAVALGGLKFFVKVLAVPPNYLYPIIFLLCCLGAFGDRNNMFDLWVMLVLGVAAYLLGRFKMPMTPIILGYILGSLAETNLRRGLQSADGSFLPFLTRPISGFFLLVAVVFLVWSLRKYFRQKHAGRAQSA